MLRLVVASPVLFVGGLILTVLVTFGNSPANLDETWQMRAAGPVLLLASPILFWLSLRGLRRTFAGPSMQLGDRRKGRSD
jgi:hypothetical protein